MMFQKLRFIQRITIKQTALSLALILLVGTAAFAYALSLTVKTTVATQKSNLKDLLIVRAKDAAVLSSLQRQLKDLTTNYQAEQQTDTSKQIATLQSQLDLVTSVSTKYSALVALIDQAKGEGIATDSYTGQLQTIETAILAQKYSDALALENTVNTSITNAMNTYQQQKIAQQQAAAKVATPLQTVISTPSQITGSTYTTTTIDGYHVTLVSIDLNTPKLRIITDTQNAAECTTNCNVTDLMNFYTRNKGFAAINGTYFCPTAYPSCVGKTNSFDFPFYNTNEGKWINYSNISWVNRAAMTFSGVHPTFYPNAQSVPGGGMSAGFVMAPGLVQNGQIIVQNYPLDAKSSTAVTTRGALGIKGNTLMVAIINGATVPQSATVMQGLGATDAIELDGGGSTALIYNGQYMLGPGRNIPNALIFSLQ